MTSNAIITLESCSFSSCAIITSSTSVSYGGGAIAVESSVLNVYSSTFRENTARYGKDILASSVTTSVTIHVTCPESWAGSPSLSDSLDTSSYSSASISGTNSFGVGSCILSCPAREGWIGGGECSGCTFGKFSAAGSSFCGR